MNMARLIIHRQPIPPQVLQAGTDFMALAEDLYALFYLAEQDPDARMDDVVTYVLDSDWMGHMPTLECGCHDCDVCTRAYQWESVAYEILEAVKKSVVPVPMSIYIHEDQSVALLPPAAVAINIVPNLTVDNPYWAGGSNERLP